MAATKEPAFNVPPPREYRVDVIDDEPLFQSRTVEDTELDITPMIDITFLLLIFFIVASKKEDAQVTLPAAKHGTAVAVKESAIITLGESNGEEALVYLGDGKSDATLISASDPETQEEHIISYLEDQLQNENKIYVVIKAEKGVRHGDVARVSKAVGKVQAEATRSIYVAVVEIQ